MREPRRGLTIVLALATAACASMQQPPGGPPDTTPPMLLSVTPDSGTIVAGFKDDAEFQFDEVISENSGGGLAKLFLVSPRPKALKVSWHRSRISVKPHDGWHPGTVYDVTLLPGIADLRNNRMAHGAETVFSTGGPIPDTRLAGAAVNWDAGSVLTSGLIEALHLPDSLVYVGRTDSLGAFALIALPTGRYTVYATVDANNNGIRDPRELYDSNLVTLDSVFSDTLWAIRHDTAGPQLKSADRVDSVTVRLTFREKVDTVPPDTADVRVLQLPDSTPVAIAAAWRSSVFDSVRKAEAAAAHPDTAQGDTTKGKSPADTTHRPPPPPPDTTARRAAPPTPARTPGGAAGRPAAGVNPGGPGTAAPDTGAAARLLAKRPKLEDNWVVRLVSPMVPGGRYLFEAHATNPAGYASRSRAVLVIPDTSKSQTPTHR